MRKHTTNHREQYSKAFRALDDLLPNTIERSIKDAKIHKYFIDHMKVDFASISFRAVVAHIRYEIATPDAPQIYTSVFQSYNWCKRLQENLPL